MSMEQRQAVPWSVQKSADYTCFFCNIYFVAPNLKEMAETL